MAFETTWLLDDHVISTVFSGEVTLDDLQENDRILLEMVEGITGNGPVHIICDVRNVDKFPTQIGPIKKSSEPYLRHDAMGWFILVGLDNRVLRFIGSTIAQITKLKMKNTDTMEEAISVLRRVDVNVSAWQE